MTDLSIIAFTLGSLPNTEPIFIREDEAVEINVSVEDAIPTWYELLPKPLDYDNTENCSPKSGPECSVNIEWYWKEIPAWRGKHSVLFHDDTSQFELGTHRFIVVSGELPSPKPENTLEIVVRRDDTYVGYATELIGVPFVFWPKEVVGGHQTDLRMGADCAATVIYGKRRMGSSWLFRPEGIVAVSNGG